MFGNNKALVRRKFLQLGCQGAVAAAACLTPSLWARAQEMAKELNWLTWETYTKDAYLDPYREATGTTFNLGEIANDDELLAKMLSGGTREWDVFTPGLNTIPTYIRQGAVQPINLDNVPNAARIWEPFKKVSWNKDSDGNVYALPMAWGINALAYRTDKMDMPESWADLFDPKYKGKVALWDYAVESILVAALYVGIPVERIWVMNDRELAECKKALMAQRKNIRTYWSSLSDVTNLLASGEIYMAYSWVTPVYELQDQGVPIGLAIPKEGAVGWADNNCISSGVMDPDRLRAAESFINYIMGPDFGETVAKLGPYAPGTDLSADRIPPDHQKKIFMDDISVMDTFIWRLQPEGYDRWVKVWEEVKAG